MWWNTNNMDSGGWVAMAFAGVALWSLLVVAIVAVVAVRRGRAFENDAAQTTERSCLRVLDDRFARGEIEADEYRSRREILCIDR